MIKFTFLVVYMILILGLMVNEIQGKQGICHKILADTDCGLGSCTALCLQLWKGTGKCVATNDGSLICLCNFHCIIS
ncbi:PREDICTED: putative defensin-like protein 126 [Camelina sativa]|uniref:Defensin-like protein 126 n=1 Tax=Camelina sativa TaxID=90675 RepID=A0ABM1R8Z8_CAMSA|nr:PREDICTED: putative defensin-like protein 126 [Camelina sativa]